LLVDKIDWSAVFWLHIPVVVAAIAGLQFVPESRDSRKQPLDIPGAALITGGLLGVVYGIIQGGEDGWTSGAIIGSFIVGGILLVAFVLVELRSSHPMLPLHYFKRPDFTGSFLVIMLLMLAMIGVFFFLTQYFQLVQGRTALYAGVALMPIAATMMAGAGFASKTEAKLGPRTISVIASLIIMSGMGVFTQLEVDSGYLIPALGLALFGLGAGMIMTVLTDSIMASVPVDDAGVGSAMNDTSRELGFALGIAIIGAIVTGVYRNRVTDAIRDVVPESVGEVVGDSLGSVGFMTQNLPADVASTVIEAANQSFVDAMSIGYIASAAFIGVALVIALTVVPNRIREHQAEEFDAASPDFGGSASDVGVSEGIPAPAVAPVVSD
jgi:predicted MFS family arabinose efflux permease